MKLKSFPTNNPNHNPFRDHITDDEFTYMIEQGFEKGTYDGYSHLYGDICYTKSLQSSIGWVVNIYITENGISVDHDYDCGGNSRHWLWWFKNGKYTRREYTKMWTAEEDVEYTKIGHTFEDAWNNMIDVTNKL